MVAWSMDRSRPRLIDEHGVLGWMRLLDVSSSHLLHHEIAVNLDVLGQDARPDAPFARNGEDADRRSGVHQTVYAVGHIGKCEPVCCLLMGSVRWFSFEVYWNRFGRTSPPGFLSVTR